VSSESDQRQVARASSASLAPYVPATTIVSRVVPVSASDRSHSASATLESCAPVRSRSQTGSAGSIRVRMRALLVDRALRVAAVRGRDLDFVE